MNKDTKSTAPKPFIFVLMPFDEKFDNIYYGIKEAAKDADAYAERIDKQIFTEGILDRIFNQINKADVIVAEMTGRNPNVFYEVGYAHALGKIVLLLTQNADDIPFDLKHRQHIVHDGRIENLCQKLKKGLEWAIGESKRQRGEDISGRFMISILGKEIPEASLSQEIPVVKVTALPQKNIEIPVNICNSSIEITPNITHIYLFTFSDSTLLPCEFDNTKYNWRPLDAIDMTTFDGLSKQFRLNVFIPSLPPGAVDKFLINLMFSGKYIKSNKLFRLRIYSLTCFYDFPFRIEFE